MFHQRVGPRFEYRTQESKRVKESPTLAAMFTELKTLAVDLGFYGSNGVARNSQIKYMPNLANAKSVFRVDCPNNGCIGGDFDLSERLADAVHQRQTAVTGEMTCQGWQSKTTINSVRCHNILRFTISLGY
jgi:hypothetical protein